MILTIFRPVEKRVNSCTVPNVCVVGYTLMKQPASIVFLLPFIGIFLSLLAVPPSI
ncbi:ABC transporter permease [Staphylococcus phage JPL-50]|uniref:ABC transporter permease n=1 Tax=Staphylococcus phage JPL-50 TaxID=2851077 RepID=A0A8F3C9Q4_9CAUD|nr:ABC transporter permease [Staphylococcus phage JPL-50]QWY14492.1 ABC transporter permease [Staphylococcus phage JPL-50]